MIKAVIFDVDGLLADTEPLHFLAWKETLEKYGIKLAKADFMKVAGIGTAPTAAYIARKYALDSGALFKEKTGIYARLIKKVRLMKGAKDAVMEFKKSVAVAAASSSRIEDVSFVLRKVGILRLLDSITTGSEVKRIKPYPDIYLLAAKKLHLKPKECVAFEDTSAGVTAAKRAGMYCVAVPNGYTKTQDFSRADLVAKSLKNIDMKKILNMDKM